MTMMPKDDNSTTSSSMIEEEEEEEEDYKPTARYRLTNEFHSRLDEPKPAFTALKTTRRECRYGYLLLCFDYLRRG